ncbi:MAG: sulfotransferase domain-containing protein [Pseudomonadota bacterium]
MWLASYPKSGNTWLRAFLANYIFNLPEPVPVNQLSRLGLGDSNTLAHTRAAGGKFDPTNPRDTVRVRRKMLDIVVSNGADLNLMKTHNQLTKAFGVDLFPRHQTKGAVYVIRDPRDMAVSYASHHGMSLDETVHRLNHPQNATTGNQQNVHQFLGRWSDHVNSWARAKGFKVLIIRYEDMLATPETVFTDVVKAVGLDVEEERLEKSIRFSSFKQLQSQEEKSGFVENSPHQKSFFRSGQSGGWRESLGDERAAQIEADHAKVMRRFGYLDA